VHPSRFAGKVGVVTAAAGGIGSATARAFAVEGAHVVMVDVNDDAGTDICQSLQAEGLAAEYRHCDVSRRDELAELFGIISAQHDRIDFAVNTVGGSGEGDLPGMELHQQTESAWDATIALCLRTTFLCMEQEIKAMLETGGGCIVNVSSMAGLRVTPYASPAYSAAKAAVNHLTRFAAVAYAGRSIRVNAVAPGLTATPNAVAALGEGVMDEVAVAFHCIPRAAEPSDQANAIVWLCSDEAAMVTGHILPVDGGWDAK
jgi:NAD(P)-dependent dehydrogenase (short-subunit alcohol dehydrogenase family)